MISEELGGVAADAEDGVEDFEEAHAVAKISSRAAAWIFMEPPGFEGSLTMGRLAQLASEREIRFSGPGQGRIMGGRTIQGEPMRRMLWALLVLPLAAACAPISVTDDYDTQTDFTKLRTYAWHVAPAGAPAVDSLTQQRIVRAVDDALEAKGFRKADSGTP